MWRVYGIEIDKSIEYRFVKYRFRKTYDEAEPDDMLLLGTFHVWNDTFYIDISADLYNKPSLERIVKHETRHMIVEYLREQKIIDLYKYTEEIADEENEYYNNMFDGGVGLLRLQQEKNI